MPNFELNSYLNPLMKPIGSRMIGFDSMFKDFDNLLHSIAETPNYPPYNILKVSDNSYMIELALAGFKKEDIQIDLKNNRLTITNKKPDSSVEVSNPEDSNIKYHVRGIAKRDFERVFVLGEHIKVLNAKMEDGILGILLQEQIPEDKLKTIEIE